MVLQILRGLRNTASAKIFRRSGDHSANCSDFSRPQRRICQPANPERDIKSLIDHVGHPVEQDQLHIHIGIKVTEFGDDRRDIQPPEEHRRGDRKRADWIGLLPCSKRLCGFDFGNDALAFRGVSFPRFCQPDGPGGAHKQVCADRFLQSRDRARDRCRAGVERSPGGSEAMSACDLEEGLHRLYLVHRYDYSAQ